MKLHGVWEIATTKFRYSGTLRGVLYCLQHYLVLWFLPSPEGHAISAEKLFALEWSHTGNMQCGDEIY